VFARRSVENTAPLSASICQSGLASTPELVASLALQTFYLLPFSSFSNWTYARFQPWLCLRVVVATSPTFWIHFPSWLACTPWIDYTGGDNQLIYLYIYIYHFSVPKSQSINFTWSRRQSYTQFQKPFWEGIVELGLLHCCLNLYPLLNQSRCKNHPKRYSRWISLRIHWQMSYLNITQLLSHTISNKYFFK